MGRKLYGASAVRARRPGAAARMSAGRANSLILPFALARDFVGRREDCFTRVLLRLFVGGGETARGAGTLSPPRISHTHFLGVSQSKLHAALVTVVTTCAFAVVGL